MRSADEPCLERTATPESGTVETLPFLLLGEAPPLVPSRELEGHVGAPCAGLVLRGGVTPAEVAEVLDLAPDPAVPIAVIGTDASTRCDYAAETFDTDSAADLRQRFAPILRRLAALPFRAAPEDRAELTILRLAYSRNASIQAVFDPSSRNLVEYPLLGRAGALRLRLEGLARLGLLHRRHFTRTHLCRRCESARLHAFEACPACNGADLIEQSIVHHYRCGWQAPESSFVADHSLVCPKCRRELRHHGVDYDKPGSVVVCRSCHESAAEPVVRFACLDCPEVMPSNEAAAIDWYHYDLAEEGLQSLRNGHIPHFDVGDQIDGHPRAFTPREFRLLAAEGIRVARRYGRPFAVAKIAFADRSSPHRDHGPVIADNGFRRAVDVIVDALRDSDFIGSLDGRSVLIGLPETSEHDALHILERLTEQMRQAAAHPIELVVSAAEGERAAELVAQERDR